MAGENSRDTEGKEFNPRLIGFVCKWCTGTAADLAGTSRIQYPSNISLIRLMCSGAVDPVYVLRALLEGADGVLIGGCLPGDCHYISGNYKARRRFKILNTILESLDLQPERLWTRWISAAEGRKFAETVSEMTKEMRTLGPNPAKQCRSL
jgi:F420-non-reducing hydrogenase iron-sulfur subunit